MTSPRRLLAGAAGLALVVAACANSTPATASAPAASAPSVAPASAAPSQAPAASGSAAASAAPSTASAAPSTSGAPAASMPEISLTPGGAASLEATLPSSAGGVTFTKTSFDGASIPGAGMPFDSSKLDPTLKKFGKSIADVKIAIATSSSGTPMVYALQLAGVPATTFMADAGIDTTGFTQTTISGKSAWSQTSSGMTEVIYPKNDVVYMIVLANPAQTQAIMAALP